MNGCTVLVGHLNSHRRLAGDGSLDTNARCCKIEGDIVNKVKNGADTDTRLGKQLISCDRGSAGHVLDLRLYVKALQGLNQLHRICVKLFLDVLVSHRGVLGENIDIGEFILLYGSYGRLTHSIRGVTSAYAGDGKIVLGLLTACLQRLSISVKVRVSKSVEKLCVLGVYEYLLKVYATR